MGTSRKSARRVDPRVAVVLGSSSDLPVIEGMRKLLDRFGIAHVVEIASAHRQPDKLRRFVKRCDREGVAIYVAVAGMAAHLPGVLASLTARPVIGVPVAAGPLAGIDALL
ncbi:AIR carboxylase family protein, partial [bacterium]|nr:AIR carboxylase family protein [bacterium]